MTGGVKQHERRSGYGWSTDGLLPPVSVQPAGPAVLRGARCLVFFQI